MKKNMIDWSKVDRDFSNPTKREQWLIKVLEGYKEMSVPKCTRCDELATTQTVRGKDSEDNFNLPQNYGWYCDKCYQEGLEMEKEAMYGN